MSKIKSDRIRFECPTCKAKPGRPCTYRGRAQHPHGLPLHKERLDRYAEWAIREAVAAANAGYEDRDEPTTTAEGVGNTPLEALHEIHSRQCPFSLTSLSERASAASRPRGGC